MATPAILLADQGFNSITNIVVTLLVAQAVSLEQFGLFATAQLGVSFGQTVAMASIGDRWLQGPPPSRPPRYAAALSLYRRWALVAGALALALSLVLGLSAVVVALAAVPAVAGLDYVRVTLFAEGRARAAVGLDLAYGTLQLGGVALWLADDGWHGAAGAWLTWAVAAWAVFGLAASGRRRTYPLLPPAERPSPRSALSFRYAGEIIAVTGGAQLSQLLVSADIGIAFNGLYRAATIPFGPLVVALQASRAMLIPALRPGAHRSPRTIILVVSGVYVGAAGVCLGAALLVTQSATLRPLIGGLHPSGLFVVLTALTFVTMGLYYAAFYFHRAQGADRAVTTSRGVLLGCLIINTAASLIAGTSTAFLVGTSGAWVAGTVAMVLASPGHWPALVGDRRRWAGALRPVALVLVGTCALAAGFVIGPSAGLACGALVAAVSVLVVLRPTFAQLGLVATIGWALTAPWNGVLIAHIRPSDALLVVGLGCLGAAGTRLAVVSLPAYVVQLAVVLVLLLVISVLFPTSPYYLDGRTVLDAAGQPIVQTGSDIGLAARWLVSLLAIPILVRLAHTRRPEVATWIATAYVAGVGISSAVAVAATAGLTVPSSLYVPGSAGRQAGLTIQPNHLAATCVMAAPLCVWLIHRPATRRIGVLCLVAALLGTYESGSRGGAVVVLLALALSGVVLPKVRRRLPLIGLGLVFVVLAIAILTPSVADSVASTTRLGSHATGVTTSDAVRRALAAQGRRDFEHSPFTGVGLRVALDAHDIYLQLLAAGGVLLLASMLVFVAGTLRAALRIRGAHRLGACLFVSILGWMVFGAVENLLTDRYVYVPVALVVALSLARPAPADPQPVGVDRRVLAGSSRPAVQPVRPPAPAAL